MGQLIPFIQVVHIFGLLVPKSARTLINLYVVVVGIADLQIYGGPGSLSHDFKIWPITFQGRGPSKPIKF